MRIPLRPSWESMISGKSRKYPVGFKDRVFIDKTHDELHAQRRMEWTKEHTSFTWPIFVVWKTLLTGEEKGRVVADIRPLNRATLPDAYPLPLMADIIEHCASKPFISTVDITAFFH